MSFEYKEKEKQRSGPKEWVKKKDTVKLFSKAMKIQGADEH